MSFRIKQQINFLKEYFFYTSKKIIPSTDQIRKIIKIKNNLIMAHKNGKKIMIFGNGGSASIASHFSVDLTKNAKLRSVNYNEADLITCFSNDYGYEKWVEMTIKFYGDKGDILIVISTSGMSKNIINGINPTIVITINCHQPDLLASCNLLAPAAIAGINVAMAVI